MITSISNQKIKQVRDLLSEKKHRDASRMIVVESVRLAEEALAAGSAIHLCLFSEHLSKRGKAVLEQLDPSAAIEEVSPELMDRISDTRTSQGILLTLPIPKVPLPTIIDTMLVLDGIRDPGNMGTILRTAAALNASGVFLTKGTTDPFSPKALRAAMGAQFRVPIRWKNAREIKDFCKKNPDRQLEILFSDAECALPCWKADLTKPICLVIGCEADGVSEQLRKTADGCLKIPMLENVESFNAAISAGILLYEIQRQRKTP